MLDKQKIDTFYDELLYETAIKDHAVIQALEDLFFYLYKVCNQERAEREKSKKLDKYTGHFTVKINKNKGYFDI